MEITLRQNENKMFSLIDASNILGHVLSLKGAGILMLHTYNVINRQRRLDHLTHSKAIYRMTINCVDPAMPKQTDNI